MLMFKRLVKEDGVSFVLIIKKGRVYYYRNFFYIWIFFTVFLILILKFCFFLKIVCFGTFLNKSWLKFFYVLGFLGLGGNWLFVLYFMIIFNY